MADDGEDSELSGDEIVENIDNFDSVNINVRQRNEIERQWRDIKGKNSDND